MNNTNSINNSLDVETPMTAALSATTKTPFKTAFKITMGIGLARVLLFSIVVLTLVTSYKILK